MKCRNTPDTALNTQCRRCSLFDAQAPRYDHSTRYDHSNREKHTHANLSNVQPLLSIGFVLSSHSTHSLQQPTTTVPGPYNYNPTFGFCRLRNQVAPGYSSGTWSGVPEPALGWLGLLWGVSLYHYMID